MALHIPRESQVRVCSAGESRRILPILLTSVSNQPCPSVSAMREDVISVDVHVCAVFSDKEPFFSFLV